MMEDDARTFIISDKEYRNGFVDIILNSRVLNRLYHNKIKKLDTMIAMTHKELKKI